MADYLPAGSRFCNRCGASLAPPGLFCPACGFGAGQVNNGMVSEPNIQQMIQSGSTDGDAPPSYEHVGSPSAPYQHVGAPSAPMMAPYSVQPTMGQPYQGQPVGQPYQGQPVGQPYQSLPMGSPMGSQIPMGSPMGGQIPMGAPMGGPLQGLPMGQPMGQPYAMMGVPLGQPFEQKGPAYPSPASPDLSMPPPGDWRSMRSPFAVLKLPRLWITREVNISLIPVAKSKHEIRCLNFLHEPGVALPEGLDVTEAGKLVGQPTGSNLYMDFYFMAKLQMGLSVQEKTKRRTAREKEHKKLVKTQKKQHDQQQRKNPGLGSFQQPPIAQPDPDEIDEIKWVLIRVKIAVLSRLESFLLATFCRGVPCLFVSPMIEEGQCWIVPFFFLPTFPFAVIIDMPCKIAALFYLILAIPLYALSGFCTNNLPDSLFTPLALAESCCAGVDQEATRQAQTVAMSQARANVGT